MLGGIVTHRLVLPNHDPLEPLVVDLGFGHQQAFGSAPLTALLVHGGNAGGSTARTATRRDLPVLADLVPLVARYQAASPVFAPRTPAFFVQLPGSLEEFVEDPALDALVAFEGSTAVGFILLEQTGTTVEIVLAGTVPQRRGRGVVRTLVARRAPGRRGAASSG